MEYIVEHIARQEELVSQLQSVVEQQAAALATLKLQGGGIDLDDDDSVDGGYASGEEEFERLTALAEHACQREHEPTELDEEEKKARDVDWSTEPTAEEKNFMSVKPWLGAMHMPTNFSKNAAADEAPEVKLELEHVYGYRARTSRNNAYWIDSQTIVYPAAAVGVIHNVANNTQRFFDGHTDDIVCLDYHKGRRLVASGEQGKTPKICVWDVNMFFKISFQGYHHRAVVSVAFSPDGTKLVSVGLDDNHSIAVYDIESQQLVAECKGDTCQILSVNWNTTTGVDKNLSFVTVGVRHCTFWEMDGSSINKSRAKMGRRVDKQVFLTATCTPDYTVCGAKDGALYFFRGHKLKNIVQGHNGMVYSLATYGSYIFSGGRDGMLVEWSLAGEKYRTYDFNKHDPGVAKNSIRAIDFLDGKILAGTITSTIYELDTSTSEITPLQVGHHGNLTSRNPQDYGELWGLACHPNQHKFASCCEDGTLRVWDMTTRTMTKRAEIDDPALCCDYSPDGNYLAVGFAKGAWAIYEADTLELIKRKKQCRRRIQCIKYSPNGDILSVGSGDSVIDLYAVNRGYRRIKRCSGNSSCILAIDWDKTSNNFQTTSQAYELLFWDKEGDFKPKSSDYKDTEWATQSCTLGWTVQGIWPKYSDGSDVNAVNKSHNEKYLLSCEDSGLVKVFKFPCIGSGLDRRGKLHRRPDCYRAAGHSSHVTNGAWNHDDSYVISTGGADLCCFQWKVVQA